MEHINLPNIFTRRNELCIHGRRKRSFILYVLVFLTLVKFSFYRELSPNYRYLSERAAPVYVTVYEDDVEKVEDDVEKVDHYTVPDLR